MKKLFLLFLVIPFLWLSCPSEDSSDGVVVSIDKPTLTMVVGNTSKLTATVTGSNKAVTWSTSNSGVATVTAGTVTAVAEGTATITVTSRADASKKAQCAVTVNPRPVTDIGEKDGLSGLTAAGYFEQKNVFIGWNLGNGFDAPSYGSWTRKIDKDFLPKIKQAGFNMVRIPVTWDNSNHPAGSAPDYLLDQTTLAELVEVVDWAYDAGLVTVINIHHDGSGPTRNYLTGEIISEGGWLSIYRIKQNQANREAITAKFVKVWEQIAERFKDYGDWLIFEPFNELHNGGWGWGNIDDVEYEIINDLNQKFTNTVRAAGPKNAQRFLVIQPYCAKPHQAMADTFVLPTDSTPSKQIASIHYYDPEEFALNGRGGPSWGSEGDKMRLTNDFERYAAKFTQNNIPVIMGESGATYQNRSDPVQRFLAHTNRIAYMGWMCMEAKRNKIVPVYWDNGTIMAGNDQNPGENFGLWDRRTQGDLEVFPETDDKPGMQIIIDTMVNAVN
jgi:aryl-phospho-beta-D-glucosidase BglC (GH1 family)